MFERSRASRRRTRLSIPTSPDHRTCLRFATSHTSTQFQGHRNGQREPFRSAQFQENIIVRTWLQLKSKSRWPQGVINVMPMWMIVLFATSSNFVRPSAYPHKHEGGQIQITRAASE